MDEKVNVLNKYTVHIGSGIFNKLSSFVDLQKYSKIFLLADETINREWSKTFPKDIVTIIIPSGEESKSIKSATYIWDKLLKNNADRKSLLINLGGGVLTDIGGFVASTYMRGIDFINIPTTLLSMVDASVGGKTGIDFGGIKNVIGTFTQPIAVICNTQFLETLPNREFISGFGEIVKHGLIADKKYFQFVSAKKPKEFTEKELTQIILQSIKIKARIVESDEKETGNRRLINFGHTIGHALEALSLETNHPLLHGEAIGIGMLAEAKLSELAGYISNADLEIIKQSIINAGLPISISHFSRDKILQIMQHDKKNEDKSMNFTLLKEIGKGIINQSPPENQIANALDFISS